MALVACRECNKEISDKAAACPGCGAKVPKSKAWLWVLLALPVLFLGFGAMKANTPEGRAKSDARAAIDMCWSEQKKQLNSGGEAQFIAGACERMENDFVTKYGVRP